MQEEVAEGDLPAQPDIIAERLELGMLEDAARRRPSPSIPVRRANGASEPFVGGAAQSVARNSLMQSAGKLFSYASGLVIVALTTRLLTQTDYGNFTIAVVYLSFVYTLSDLGIGLIAVREASRSPERLGTLYNTAMSLKIVVSVGAYAAAVALVFALPYDTEAKIATCILAASMVLTSIGASFDIPFQSRLQMQAPTLAEMAIKVVTFAGTAALFLVDSIDPVHPLPESVLFYGIVSTVALSNVASFAVRWNGARKLLPGGMHFQVRGWGPLLRMALPMGIVTVLGQIHYKADTIILSLFQPPAQVAIYGLAYKLLDFMLMFFGVFAALVYPVLARYSTESRERLHAALVRVLNMCFSLAVPATVGVILLAPEIVELLGGGRYPQAALPLRILSLAMVFSTLNMVYNYLIIVQDRQRSLIWVSCTSIVANIALNLWAIPRFSYLGSAVATDITEGLGMVLGILIATRVTRAGPSIPILARVAFSCLVMGALVELARTLLVPFAPISLHPLTTLALIALGVIAYFAALYVLGGADESLTRMVIRRVPGLSRLPVRHVDLRK